MTANLTESKFNDLKAKLRELFELDKSDLDFGIYRIMAAKNAEVNEFLDRQLRDEVRRILAEHGAGQADAIQAELDKAIEQAKQLGVDPETTQKVKDLRSRLASAGGASTAELEQDVYNHLLAFFSRYYDEGDFISRRRYKGDTYAIPYNGEEVTLYWANKDQYYIKSGEWHKDYRFKAGSGQQAAGSRKSVRFKLVAATQETNNNKEPDEAKRRYILREIDPVTVEGQELVLYFEFRVPTDAERARAADGAVAIFGGDFAKAKSPKKGDEREQFCADAEKRALAAMPEDWRSIVSRVIADGPDRTTTDAKPARTLLGKHLDTFTARNTFDYFIHKDLGGFLNRELDFYIKNEVVRLDDLASLPPDHLLKLQGRVKAIRAVAGRIIDFLASIENFQKKIWLKKKFVLDTHWLVTIDRIPAELRDIVAKNPKQWEEWENLGFKPADDDPMLIQGPKWGTREYLDANDKLVVDTRLFEGDFPNFMTALLASEEVLADTDSLDEATIGVLIHAENFQALNILKQRYQGTIRCVHIDPPYNTASSGFVYKNSYRHGSWLSLMSWRLMLAKELMHYEGILQCHIDEYELEHLQLLLDSSGLVDDGVMIWDKGMGTTGAIGLATQHEYVLWRSFNGATIRLEKQNIEAMKAKVADLLKMHGSASASAVSEFRSWLRDNAELSPGERTYDTFDDDGNIYRSDNMSATDPRTDPKYFIPLKHPVTGKDCPVPRHGFRYTPSTLHQMLKDGLIIFGETEEIMPRKKTILRDDSTSQLPTIIKDGSRGKFDMDRLGCGFPFSHPVSLYESLLRPALPDRNIVLDYFAGSGTTGHAIINLNRAHGGNRKFILIEMGAYFRTVLKPRIAKVIYSPDWRDGQAQTHGKGISALVKCFTLESYEDALNNLPAPTGELLANADPATKDALITYALDLELGPRLLDLDVFRDPWGYWINAQPAGEEEIRPHRVDLVETFNYLIGLKVKAYGPIERYTAEFERAEHPDGLGRLKVRGRLRRDKQGAFVFQRVEGELNDGNDTRVLVIWRKLTDDPEQDAAVLEAWMQRHREDTRQRSEHRDYQLIYINGPVTLPQPTQGDRVVQPIEETFKDRMFADSEVTDG